MLCISESFFRTGQWFAVVLACVVAWTTPQLSSVMVERYWDGKPPKESCVLQKVQLVIQLEVLFSNVSVSQARADVNPVILLVGSEQRCRALYARAEVIIQILASVHLG